MPSRPVQQASMAPVIVAVALVLACVFAWKGWPFAFPLWLGLLVGGWAEPPVVLTGKKDASGFLTPAGPTEERALRRAAAADQLRWRPIVPNTDWLPGWPVLGSFIAAAATAAVLFAVPVAVEQLRLVNAGCGYLIVAAYAGVRRRTAAEPDVCPGARVDTLKTLLVEKRVLAIGAGVAMVAAIITVVLTVPSRRPGSNGPGGPLTTAYKGDGIFAGLVDYGTRYLFLLAFAAGVLAALAVVARPWVDEALAKWRIVVAARKEWAPRWQTLKFDPAPFLTDRQHVGDAVVDTFMAPSNQGAMAFWPLAKKLEPTVGAGSRIAVLETPNESSEGPVPGTRHPLRFDVVTWTSESIPDLTDPSVPIDVAALLARCAAVWTHDTLGYARPILLGVEALHTQESTRAAWESAWVWPDGPGIGTIRSDMLGDLSANFGCTVLLDHRSDAFFFGALGPDEDVTFADESQPPYRVRFDRLALEDLWNFRWANVLKQATHAPTIEHSTTATAKLADGSEVNRQAFVTRMGIDPREFATNGQERKIATSLSGAPFVSVCGFHSGNQRQGDRHPQALVIYWSNKSIPNSPQALPPTVGGAQPGMVATQWVLAGMLNTAFDAGRLARPEIIRSECLTTPQAREHLWRISLRLHDGVTLAEVRGAAPRIRQSLGVSWLRITPDADGCTFHAGVEPSRAKLVNEKLDRDRLIALDWEQAWLDAGISGQGGMLPRLVNSARLPANEQVEVLDFELPPGLSSSMVKSALPKVSSSTNNSFVEMRQGPNAQTVRILVSADNPLPERVPFDFDYADRSKLLPFATGVEGEPVEFDPGESPHVLMAGTTGSGKSVLLQNVLYGALVKGWRMYVIDPVKGGADFQFAKDRCVAFAATPFEAAGVMRAVYAEVVARKDANAAAGVGSYRDLDDPPPHIGVVIDEFTSLMGQSMVPPRSEDPAMEAEREAIVAENNARTEVGVYAGKIAREARSAGVTLFLGTQKLAAKMLDSIPGAGDLKVNLARTLLGKATQGDRASALRAWEDAPKLEGDLPKGRGLWEPLSSQAMTVQTWFAPQGEMRDQLVARVRELGDYLDLSAFVAPQPESNEMPMPPVRRPPTGREPQIVDIGEMDLSLDDLDLELTLDDLNEVDEGTNSEGPALGTATAPLVVFAPEPLVERAPEPVIHDDALIFLAPHGTVFIGEGEPLSWPDWEPAQLHTEPGLVSPALADALVELGTHMVWLAPEDPGPQIGQLFSRPMESVTTGSVGALDWLDAHPTIRRVIWCGDVDGRPDLAEELGRRNLGSQFIAADPAVGLTRDDVGLIDDWLLTPAPGPRDDRPSAEVEPDRPSEVPAPRPTIPAPVDDDFGPRVVVRDDLDASLFD